MLNVFRIAGLLAMDPECAGPFSMGDFHVEAVAAVQAVIHEGLFAEKAECNGCILS